MELIKIVEKKAKEGIALAREEIVSLLEIPLGSEEDIQLRKVAHEVALYKTKGCAYIWSAVGADYAPCPMNCKFCSFGEEWRIIKEQVHYTKEQIINRAKQFVNKGARFIVLRTTEFYSIPVLIELAKEMRKQISGSYEIVFNTGEFDMTIANLMAEAGVNGIYHACRLREGIDTPFDPWERKNTMNNVYRSGLKLISLVEPIGIEHTNEEIADNFLQILKHGAVISGAMARVPVPGTPLGSIERISDERLAQIIAVLRLSGGDIVKDICVHPATPEAIQSGANIMVVETGAIPRDVHCEEDNWHGVDIEQARTLLENAGYNVYNHE
ncbi:MAG: radical SAM protein [Clostridia bacterium]|nr:radical SAM protein [Clostridia bacterium]